MEEKSFSILMLLVGGVAPKDNMLQLVQSLPTLTTIPIEHPPKDNMLAIQMACRTESNKKLRSVRMRPSICHTFRVKLLRVYERYAKWV
mmetsp:Transcript_65237/g.96464  ORF Transcript_65237/g.96464 Transcript_65237/m.96464 type:complete len:89 (-) Transcript_65237:77-343(-)